MDIYSVSPEIVCFLPQEQEALFLQKLTNLKQMEDNYWVNQNQNNDILQNIEVQIFNQVEMLFNMLHIKGENYPLEEFIHNLQGVIPSVQQIYRIYLIQVWLKSISSEERYIEERNYILEEVEKSSFKEEKKEKSSYIEFMKQHCDSEALALKLKAIEWIKNKSFIFPLNRAEEYRKILLNLSLIDTLDLEPDIF